MGSLSHIIMTCFTRTVFMFPFCYIMTSPLYLVHPRYHHTALSSGAPLALEVPRLEGPVSIDSSALCLNFLRRLLTVQSWDQHPHPHPPEPLDDRPGLTLQSRALQRSRGASWWRRSRCQIRWVGGGRPGIGLEGEESGGRNGRNGRRGRRARVRCLHGRFWRRWSSKPRGVMWVGGGVG
jgi:hypothetical protein